MWHPSHPSDVRTPGNQHLVDDGHAGDRTVLQRAAHVVARAVAGQAGRDEGEGEAGLVAGQGRGGLEELLELLVLGLAVDARFDHVAVGRVAVGDLVSRC